MSEAEVVLDLEVIGYEQGVFCPDCLKRCAVRCEYVFVEPTNIEVQGRGYMILCPVCDYESGDDET